MSDFKDQLKRLISQFRASGDEYDFDRICSHIEKVVEGFFYYHLRGRPQDAEDCLQEFALKLWNKRTDLDPERHHIGWFKAVALNLLRDYWRKTNARQEHFVAFFDGAEDLQPLVIEFDRGSFLDEIRARLSEFSARDQQLIRVYLLENNDDLTQEQVAEKLGRSYLSVRKRWPIIIRKIRGMFNAVTEDVAEDEGAA